MSKLVYASLAPLFDRLLGSDVGTDNDAKLDSVGLKESLAREMGQLFSTKSRLTLQEYLAGELTVLDYGLPDFTALSPASEKDTTLMSEAMTKCLENFEPRLSLVLVTARSDEFSNTTAHATVMASVTIGRQALRVDFDLAFTPSEGMRLLPA
jgi:type VI secretion system lysozyme-like protein